VLAGPSGVGKTLLTTMLPGILGEVFSPLVRLVFPQMSTPELLAYLADELSGVEGSRHTPCADTVQEVGGLQVAPAHGACGLRSPGADSTVGTPGVQASVRRIQSFLTANSQQGRHTVVVIDEAHLLQSVETFEALRLLLNFEPGGVPAMTLLLVGEPAILPALDRMPQWEERLAVKCLLKPLGESETAAYVEHRLRVAGAVRSIVDPNAIPTLHALTHGIARQINRLCDLSLLVGFAEEQPMLGAEHFESVCRELVMVSPE
jgi:hypothetical protein